MADAVAAQLADVQAGTEVASLEDEGEGEPEQPLLAGAGEEPEQPPQSIKKATGWNSFFQSVAPDVMEELGEGVKLGEVSTVVGKMWKELPVDKRKDWRVKAQQRREDLGTGLLMKKCARCDTSFSRDKDLKYHQKGCQDCICTECDERFNHKLKLKRHMAKHHSESFKCKKCRKTFAEKRNLVRHQKSHGHD